jgi:hypothetical protein
MSPLQSRRVPLSVQAVDTDSRSSSTWKRAQTPASQPGSPTTPDSTGRSTRIFTFKSSPTATTGKKAQMSSDLSAEITAIATAALAVFAIVTAAFAFLAYRKQSQEVGVLLKENEREAIERRIAQAAQVFTGAPHGAEGNPYAKNGSDFPIFDAQFWYPEPGGASGPDDLGMIEPGGTASSRREFPAGEALPRTILTFRDAAGVLWRRMPDGTLKEQSPALTYESVLGVLGVRVPWRYPQAPGPEGKHNLPTMFRRIYDKGNSIMVYPWRRGILSLSITVFSRDVTRSQLPDYHVKVTSSDQDNQGVYIARREESGPSPRGYTVIADVWNYRDDPVHAEIVADNPPLSQNPEPF